MHSFPSEFLIYDKEYATISVLMKSECIYDIHFILSGSHLELKEKTKEFLSGEWRNLFNNSKNIHIKYYSMNLLMEYFSVFVSEAEIFEPICQCQFNGDSDISGLCPVMSLFDLISVFIVRQIFIYIQGKRTHQTSGCSDSVH